MNIIDTSAAARGGPTAPRFTLAMLLWLTTDGAARLSEFRDRSTELFKRYDLRIERQLAITGKGQIVGENRFEQPDLIQLLSFPSVDAFEAYLRDPSYIDLSRGRDEGIRRMTVLGGAAQDIAHLVTPGAGRPDARFYGVGLARFIIGGERGMDAFNDAAQSLFARHGMHIESMLTVRQVLTPIGRSDDMNPQRLVVFFLDEPAALAAYAADPEYLALAPMRDSGLETYDLFFGKVPSTTAMGQ